MKEQSDFRTSPWLLAGAFFVALLPFAATFLTFHPDERHYVDGAAWMVQSGDYLTPRIPEGEYRFNKPVLTYWLVAGPYKLFGLSPITSRIAFLAISSSILVLVYQTTMLVYGNRTTAMLAAAMMATHAPLITIAASSLPDVPLTFCFLLAGYGLLGILVMQRTERRFAWCVWLGVGLGIAIKGLPIVLLIGYAIAFATTFSASRRSWRQLFYIPSMIVGTAIALWWYVAMYAMHGEASLAMFFGDQVGERFAFAPLKVISHLLTGLAVYAACFLPWSLPIALEGLRRRIAWPTITHERTAALFVGGWSLVALGVAAIVDRWAMRYLLLATPMMAVVVANAIMQIEPEVLHRHWRRFAVATAGIALLIVALIVPVRFQLSASFMGSIVAIAMVLLTIWLCWPSQNRQIESPRVALAMLSLAPIAFLLLAPIALPDSGQELSKAFNREDSLLEDEEFRYVGNPALAAKTRVSLGGDMRLLAIHDPEDLAIPDFDVILMKSDEVGEDHREEYKPLLQLDAGHSNLKPGPFLKALLAGKLHEYVASRRQKLVVMTRRDRSSQSDRVAGETASRSVR